MGDNFGIEYLACKVNCISEDTGEIQKMKAMTKELETKQKDERSQEAMLLRRKIKELEVRLKEQELHIQQIAATREVPDVASATPNEVKTCFKQDNFGNGNTESNSNTLRTSNRFKTSTRRNDSLNHNEMTRKKRVSRSGKTENNGDDPHMKEKRIRKEQVRPTKSLCQCQNIMNIQTLRF